MYVTPPARGRPRDGRLEQRWHAELRRRCQERLTQSRKGRVAQARSAVVSPHTQSDAPWGMDQDYARGAAGAVGGASSWSEADERAIYQQLGHDAYIELMAATEQDLLRELEADVAFLSEGNTSEYEAYLTHEDALLRAAADEVSAGLAAPDTVPCPLCMRGALQLRADGIIVCSLGSDGCALQLDSRGHHAPVEALRARMCSLLQSHGQQCRGLAYCRMPPPGEEGAGRLLLTCNECGTCATVA